jgi:hypothetical protein
MVKWRRERFEFDIGLLAAGCVPRRSDRQVPAEAVQIAEALKKVSVRDELFYLHEGHP